VRELLEIAIPVIGLAIMVTGSMTSKGRWLRRPIPMPLRFWAIVSILLVAFALLAHYV
jgi:hypothetical protein